MRIPITPPLPVAISIEIASICNLNCPECVVGTKSLIRGRDFMELPMAKKIAGEFSGKALSVYLYFQGEPMLHPRFFEIVELFRGMRPLISTNGHFLDRENCVRLAGSSLRKLIISYDGVTADTYNIYRRGGDHRAVTEGIICLARLIREQRSSLGIEIQFLVGGHNEHEIPEAEAFARKVNAGFRVKSMQVLDPARAVEWMPLDEEKARYTKENGSLKKSFSRGCLRMWTTAVITVDGDVIPCCYDKNARHVMGNLYNNSFSEIWHDPKYSAFRRAVIGKRDNIDLCSKCPQGRTIFFRS